MSGKWFLLLLFTLFTVIVWIGIGVVLNLTSKPLSSEYTRHMSPIGPTINETVIDEINKREADNFVVKRDDLK